MYSQFWWHHKTIRYVMQCIHEASGNRICQNFQSLEVAKNGMFFSPKISTFGNFWTCSKLPIPGPETYLDYSQNTVKTKSLTTCALL